MESVSPECNPYHRKKGLQQNCRQTEALIMCGPLSAEYSTKFCDNGFLIDLGYFGHFRGTNCVVEGPDD